MGDIKRKKSKFSKPKKKFDKQRIEEENALIKKYGLKNKREIWKAKSEISKIRRRAKSLIGSDSVERKEFFNKLQKKGFDVNQISDVLALTEENWLDRRLQTIVFKKGFAKTPKQARQLITHKKILVNGEIVNIPSFFINRELEDKISIKETKIKEEKNGEE